MECLLFSTIGSATGFWDTREHAHRALSGIPWHCCGSMRGSDCGCTDLEEEGSLLCRAVVCLCRTLVRVQQASDEGDKQLSFGTVL